MITEIKIKKRETTIKIPITNMITKEIDLSLLYAHPLNRDFPQDGQEWEDFCASVRMHGVIQPLLVRQMGEHYEVFAGNRRTAAARLAGLGTVECVVRDISNQEVLELLAIENMERVDPDPVQEGRLLVAMEAAGTTVEEMAQRLNRSVAWIVTRQRLLDLGDEVLAAVCRPKDAPGHLGMGTVEVLLQVTAGDRERAIQMVLHPEWTEEVLGPREAAEVIRAAILDPARKKAAWERENKGLVKAWKKALGDYLTKDEKKDVVVQALRYEDLETCRLRTRAEAVIPPDQLTDEADDGRRWVHLAVCHGLPVWVVPGESGEDATAVVDERLIRLAEEARADHGLVATLLSPKQLRRKAQVAAGADALPAEDAADPVSAVARQVALMDGDGDPNYDSEEPPETVITQSMESRAWVDLGPVRQLRTQLAPLIWPEDDAPADAPDWLRAIWAGQCGTEDLTALCDWIIGLSR
jgi:ParB family chromosome partitioning protein